VRIFGIRQDLALGDFTFTRHTSPLFGTLRAVLAARLLAVLDARRVERAADDVIAHPWEILHATAANQHDRVLRQIVPLAWNVRGNFHAVGEPHAGDLAERRVRLFRGRGIDASADTALLRALLQGWRRALRAHLFATSTDELIDRRHSNA